MKPSRDIAILALIALALALALFARRAERLHYELPTLPNIYPETVSSITISPPAGREPVVLNKSGALWRMAPEGYRADRARAQGMLEALSALRLTAMVSDGKNTAPYGLSADERIAVTLTQPLLAIEIGKLSTGGAHTFVRIAGDQNVYQALGDMRGVFDIDKTQLREMTVLEVQGPVQEISARAGQLSAKIVRGSDGQWAAADKHFANALLTTLASLDCAGYIDDEKSLADPLITITVKGKELYAITIHGQQGDLYEATSSGADGAFLLSAFDAQRIIEGWQPYLKP